MAKLLLINPSYVRTYGTNQAGLANPVYPVLSLACLAAAARRAGHHVEIHDLSYRTYDPQTLKRAIIDGGYDAVGITATTPLVNQMRDISFLIKDISPNILVIGGGAHASSLPVETMRESALDYVVYGEGDETIVDILNAKPAFEILGVCWRDGSKIIRNAPRPLIHDLDLLPMPAWDLYPIEEYRGRITKILSRYSPMTTIEFSRGCVFKCDFCGSKNTMGFGYRKKSPERCVEELKYLVSLGYREVLLTDDIFTSDNNWAVAVCKAIIRSGVKIAWTCTNGIRVDSANDELFQVMKQAGCYRVHFGFESGNDAVLKAFGKGGKASLAEGIRAVNLARKAGLDTWGMFMLGLSADTESTMCDTINFARKIPVDVMKFGITVPFPGTPMFTNMTRTGNIKTYNWDDFNVYNETSVIFDHPSLSWESIQSHYRKAYIKCYYLNPRYVFRRLIRSVRLGEVGMDVGLMVRFLPMLLTRPEAIGPEKYAYRDRWQPLNISRDDINSYPVQQVRKLGEKTVHGIIEISTIHAG
jgi:anaerobic magnesium-protoporphyrin IX monomethyl ester cyclase